MADPVETADACKTLTLSPTRLAEAMSRATLNDMSAQENLRDHYNCVGDNASATLWEGRLIEQGHLDSIGSRSSELFSAALDLKDNDQTKLVKLKEALKLTIKARELAAEKVVVDAANTNEDLDPSDYNDFIRRISLELTRVQAIQNSQRQSRREPTSE